MNHRHQIDVTQIMYDEYTILAEKTKVFLFKIMQIASLVNLFNQALATLAYGIKPEAPTLAFVLQ